MNSEQPAEHDFVAELATRVAGVAKLYQSRLTKADAIKFEEPLSKAMKKWMVCNTEQLDTDDDGHPYIMDGEHMLRAHLAPRTYTEYDLRPLTDQQILAMARKGLLSVNVKAFDVARDDAPEEVWNIISKTMGFRFEKEGPPVLYVEPVNSSSLVRRALNVRRAGNHGEQNR